MNLYKPHLDIVIAIDQTGAVGAQGQPRPLPCSVWRNDGGRWRCLSLKSEHMLCFNEVGLWELLTRHDLELNPSINVFFAIDAVVGLPEVFVQDSSPGKILRRHMANARSWPGFGLRAGQSFFNDLRKTYSGVSESQLLRRVERELGANSLFTPYPFQKNVQTGTFRMWKEMADEPHWLLYGFEGPEGRSHQRWVAEGYPSLSWKVMYGGLRGDLQREPKLHAKKIRLDDLHHIERLSADHQDAAVLALHTIDMYELGQLNFKPHQNIEGGILGY